MLLCKASLYEANISARSRSSAALSAGVSSAALSGGMSAAVKGDAMSSEHGVCDCGAGVSIRMITPWRTA